MPSPVSLTPHQAPVQCVTFTLGGDVFGLEIRFVREIIELEAITEVPMMPAFVRGIINLRGAVVPVIDLSLRFGRGLTPLLPSTCVAVLSLPAEEEGGEVENGYSEIGVLLDSVCEVLDIALDQLSPTPSFGANIRGDFIKGIATINGRFAIVLDAQRALSVTELSALAEAVLHPPALPA